MLPHIRRPTLGPVLLLACSIASCAQRAAAPAYQVEALNDIPEEKLGVDDVFDVRVLAEPELSGSYRISADGTVDYPFAGRLVVLGLTSGRIAALIAEKLRGQYVKNPQVSVMVREWNSRKIVVLGQVQKPGPVAYFPRMTIVDAIAAAGGFTSVAKKNAVTLRREQAGKVQSLLYRVADITEGKQPNITVLPGDVIVIEERLF
jgi:protein involved in polysaccharide export with SLBB domain